MARELEEPPAQKMRKFKTPGDGRVTWIWDPTDIRHNLRHWGKVSCTGCKERFAGIDWHAANRHARECHQEP
jgi:hypothetical protein